MIREKRNKAQVAVMVAAKRNIDNLRVRAPFDGFVSVRQNIDGARRRVLPGAVMPEFRPATRPSPARWSRS